MIDLEVRDDVRILRLDEGENRFNRKNVDAIHAALDAVSAVDGAVALVTVGTDKFFSNGLDLDWMGTDEGRADAPFLDDVHRILQRVLHLDMVTVAAINGHAFAGGAMLAVAHDRRVMREDRGYWCIPEVDLGLPLTDVMFATLDAHLPRHTLADAALTGKRYDAADALAGGIVHETAAEEAVLDRAIEIAASLAGKDRNVIAAHKQLLYGDPVR